MSATAATVAPMRALSLTYRVVLTQLVTRGRLAALLLVGVVVAIVAAAVGASDSIDDPLEAAVRVIADLGFTALVPIVALVFATASLGRVPERFSYRGVAPAIAEQLSLQHQCRRQANRTSTGAVYGAQAPSDPALTRRLLSLLGQTAPSARALPPERQADYYRQFLYVLWPGAQEGDAVKAARAKLVARLIALPAPP